MDIKIRPKLIEIEDCVSDRFVILNMKLRHCLLSDTKSETYMAQYTISYDVIKKKKEVTI